MQGGKKAEEDGRDAGCDEEVGADFEVDVDVIAEDDGVGEVALEQKQGRSRRVPRPRAPAARLSRRLSVRNWRMRRLRCAPRAVRRATSRSAAVAAGEKKAGDVGAGDEPYGEDGDVERDDGGTGSAGERRLSRVPCGWGWCLRLWGTHARAADGLNSSRARRWRCRCRDADGR